MMGRLKYRTSYGQNVLAHSKEVAYLAGVMAREVGLDAHVSVRAAFVHDIGKAMDRELQGTHLEIGIEFLRQHGESDAVIDAMAAHHMDIDWPSLEAMIVQAADAISAARPGGSPGYSRVVHQAVGETGGDRRLIQGRVEGVRPAGWPRDPDHGRERASLRRGSGVAVEGHRQADRERAPVPGPDQGDGHSRKPVRSTTQGRSDAEAPLTVGELGEHALIERLVSAAPPRPPVRSGGHRGRCRGGRTRAGHAHRHHDRRVGRRGALRPDVHDRRRYRPQGVGRQPQRPCRDGGHTPTRAAVAGPTRDVSRKRFRRPRARRADPCRPTSRDAHWRQHHTLERAALRRRDRHREREATPRADP